MEEAQECWPPAAHHTRTQPVITPVNPSPPPAAAQELAEATEPDHAAAEAADLFYFGMVKLVAAGASLAQVPWVGYAGWWPVRGRGGAGRRWVLVVPPFPPLPPLRRQPHTAAQHSHPSAPPPLASVGGSTPSAP